MQFFFTGLFLIFGFFSSAQVSFESYLDLKLENDEDYNNTLQSYLYAADYILSHENSDSNWIAAQLFLIKWMEGAPFEFTISVVPNKISKNKHFLFTVYLAALGKFQMEKTDSALSQKKLELGAVQLVCRYVLDFNIEQKGYLKRLILAYKKNELEDFLFP